MKNLIIDTNLLLLLVIGAVEGGKHIKSSKRLKDFDEFDYQTVLGFMKGYKKVFITPYIATEVSNLIDLNRDAGKKAYEIARSLFKLFSHVDSKINDDALSETFLRYGLTDNSIIGLVKDYHILTNDNRLCEQLWAVNEHNVIPYATIKKFVEHK